MKTLKNLILLLFFFTVSQTMAQSGTWLPLTTGVNGLVEAMAIDGNNVYIGGLFNNAGGITARHIAKWDGTSWDTLGSGFDGNIYAILVDGNDIYAGGFFHNAGDVPADFIAKWDGTKWDSLGSGLNGAVLELKKVGNDIYATGTFTQAGGSGANRIARWDGTSWSALGSGLNNAGRCLETNGTDLFVGGNFTNAGGVWTTYLAKWDGTSWSAVSGLSGGGVVYALRLKGNELYAGGWFTHADGIPVHSIAKWDGANWDSVGSGVSGGSQPRVYDIAINGDDIYIAGQFTQSNGPGNPVRRVAKWNGTGWDSLGAGLNNRALCVGFYNNTVFVAGEFNQAGGNSANRVARYIYAPPVPANLSFSIPSPGTVQLDWIDTLSNEDGFIVERSVGTDTSWMILDTTTMNTPSYLDTGLTDGTYYYRVHAFNVGGNSGYSDTVMLSITLPPLPPHSLSLSVLDTGVVKLTWADSSSSEEGFVLERRDNADTNWIVVDTTGADTVMYTDAGLIIGRTYEYRVYAFNIGGNSGYSNVVSSLITGVTGNSLLPDKYALYQNYPNPFNPTTKIKFDIPKSGIVKLTIYDILGREVTRLVNNELNAGSYEMEWNAGSYSSGMYFYRIEADGFVEVKRMMLVK